MKHADLTIIVLTLNEEIHIERCLKSAFQVASQVFVIDSFSTDRTVFLARNLGAQVWQHEFKNHADQLAWALENLPINTNWIMRIDADEIISERLAYQISSIRETEGVTGYLIPLYVCFLGRVIRHGGYPQQQLRIWRRGYGYIERRWMDEKIVVKKGRVGKLSGEYFDNNLNTITWWTNKHNNYASREAIELLNLTHQFLPPSSVAVTGYKDSSKKRWIKERIYRKLPVSLRSFSYFVYRYIFLLGFLDGRVGFSFHFLQGFWYRYLVDVKVEEVECVMRNENISCEEAIYRVLGVRL